MMMVTIRSILEQVIRQVNRYRQMDVHGRPADATLFVTLAIVLLLYTLVAMRMSRRS